MSRSVSFFGSAAKTAADSSISIILTSAVSALPRRMSASVEHTVKPAAHANLPYGEHTPQISPASG